MKRNNTCIVCGESFDPRKSKMYCSNACKQDAYLKRKYKELPPIKQVIKPDSMDTYDIIKELINKNVSNEIGRKVLSIMQNTNN